MLKAMTSSSIIFKDVSFSYESASARLLEGVKLHFPRGWTGIVGANGTGKTTILKLATGELRPEQGTIQKPEHAIYCEQRTDDIPPMLGDLIEATDKAAWDIRQRLGIEDEWSRRWMTLSHGERKRAQIAVALWRMPEILAIDEPTNHLDMEARDVLARALHTFTGTGLLVSHDRELLDTLCQQCVFIEPPAAIMRPGGYTRGARQADSDEAYSRKQYELARRDRVKVEKEVKKRRAAASRADRKRSKRGIASKDHDAKDKINRARVTGKDGQAGRLLNQLGGRLKHAREKQAAIKVRKTYELGIWLPGSRSKRDVLFNIPQGTLQMGEKRVLHYPDLSMRPDDRVALTGPNGAGKSTVLRKIIDSLNIPGDRLTYIPQEIEVQSSKDIMEKARSLPSDKLGQMMTVVSRLGSRPHRLLESAVPSPGEIRKVLLALGMIYEPHLIIMDEPTNHMDLPSIECLEKALNDCPCGLLLVSHDRRFLGQLAKIQWHIECEADEQNELRMNLKTGFIQ